MYCMRIIRSGSAHLSELSPYWCACPKGIGRWASLFRPHLQSKLPVRNDPSVGLAIWLVVQKRSGDGAGYHVRQLQQII